MNFEKLFEIQAGLDEHIIQEKGLQGQDLLDKKILALQVELGELANEWRGFKFWSENQSPKPMSMVIHSSQHPMLMEYVDCLHFIFSIGNDLLEVRRYYYPDIIEDHKHVNITNQFIYLNAGITDIYQGDKDYEEFLYEFLALGKMLGFTEEQIEQAYLEKNKINHERQDTGY